MAIFEIVEKSVSGAFVKYGQLLSKKPVVILTVSLILSAVLGLGILWIESETSLEYLYTPENSQAFQDQRRVLELFPDTSGTEFYAHQSTTLGLYGDAIITSSSEESNVLKSEVLNEYLAFSDFVTNITISVDGIEYGYFNVCARRSGSCFAMGLQNLLNGSDINALLERQIPYPEIKENGEPLFLPSIFGGVKVDENSIIQSVEALRVRYYLRTDDKYNDLALQWERKFLESVPNWKGATHIQVAYSVSNSLSYELNSGTSGDIVRFSITFTLMIFYATLVCSTGNCITNRALLACMGVFAAGLAILASYGFCSYIGVKNVNVVGIMPFLIVGIGIDDMFLLISGWLETKPSSEASERVCGALGIAAVSITITSLTDLLAFCIGATNVFPAVRNFCIYTGVAVIWCYLMQLTVFGSSLVFHTWRVEGGRHSFTCTSIPPEESCKTHGKTCHCLWIFYCRGRKSKNSSEDVEDRSLFEMFPGYLSKFVLLWPVKIVVLIIFMGYLAVSIWGAIQLEQGLLLSNLVSPSSYLYPYLDLERKYFNDNGPTIAVVIDGPLNYWEGDVQLQFGELLTELQNDTYIVDDFRISWLDSFSGFHNGSLPSDRKMFVDSVQNPFLQYFPIFMSDLIITDRGEISASRVYVRSVGLSTTNDQGRMMAKVRATVANSKLPAFAYTAAFVYYEQYVQVLPSTLLTVGCAVAAMFLVCCFFIPHPLCVIYITVTMVMIITGLFGFMHIMGLSLNSITMIHIVISIGFCVDFCAHISHAFMKAEGRDRNHRVEVALSRVAVPILNGGLSTFIGIIVLVNAASYVFYSFFRIMVLTITFGVVHALFFLPVVLSLVGPKKTSTRQEEGANDDDVNLDRVNENKRH